MKKLLLSTLVLLTLVTNLFTWSTKDHTIFNIGSIYTDPIEEDTYRIINHWINNPYDIRDTNMFKDIFKYIRYTNRGQALHVIQDAACPAHAVLYNKIEHRYLDSLISVLNITKEEIDNTIYKGDLIDGIVSLFQDSNLVALEYRATKNIDRKKVVELLKKSISLQKLYEKEWQEKSSRK